MLGVSIGCINPPHAKYASVGIDLIHTNVCSDPVQSSHSHAQVVSSRLQRYIKSNIYRGGGQLALVEIYFALRTESQNRLNLLKRGLRPTYIDPRAYIGSRTVLETRLVRLTTYCEC